MKKKVVAAMMSVALVAAVGIGGTVAYHLLKLHR